MIDNSERARDLFAAAKLDGPSEGARDAMWAGIHGSTAGGASVAALKATGMASSKLALGIALGATLTVGIAATLVVLMRPATLATHGSERIGAVPRALEHSQAKTDEAPAPIVITGRVAPVELDTQQRQPPAIIAQTRTGTTTAGLSPQAGPLTEHDRLAREARMVSEARGALRRGEPDTALRIVRAARSQAGARMLPEELTVEAQALRAMGDETGAQHAEAELAGKFPEQSIGQ
jgi:hypothetical protein